MASGALVLPDSLINIFENYFYGGGGLTIYFGACAVKVEDCFSFLGVDCDLELDWTAVVHVVDCMEILAFESLADVFE